MSNAVNLFREILIPNMAAMVQANLQTSRLYLIPLSDDHLDYEVQLDSDPNVVKFIGNGRPRARVQVEQLHRGRIETAKQVPGLGFWAGFVRSDLTDPAVAGRAGEFVGWWILEPSQCRDQGGQAELGYRLMKRFWGRGLAKEGARELIRYGFQDLGLSKIFAETMSVNTASRATMASVRMKYARTFHRKFEEVIPGSEEGEVEYAILSDEWFSAAE